MFDRISEAAEKLATGVSRRHFLGLLGRWAGAAALGLGGLLVSGTNALADPGQGQFGKERCCFYSNGSSYCNRCVGGGNYCPPAASGYRLVYSDWVANCNKCYQQYPQCP
jgi:hypothetical protein